MAEKNLYPTIHRYIEHGNGEYIKSLKQSVRKQMETRRYYRMKFSGKFVPYITDAQVMEEVELFLETAPKIFARDMQLIMNA